MQIPSSNFRKSFGLRASVQIGRDRELLRASSDRTVKSTIYSHQGGLFSMAQSKMLGQEQSLANAEPDAAAAHDLETADAQKVS